MSEEQCTCEFEPKNRKSALGLSSRKEDNQKQLKSIFQGDSWRLNTDFLQRR